MRVTGADHEGGSEASSRGAMVGGRGGAAEERRWRCCCGSRAVFGEGSTEKEGSGSLYLELRDENVTLNNAAAAEQTAGRELSARCNMQPLQWSKRPGLTNGR